MYNYYIINSMLTALSSFGLGAFVYLKAPQKSSNKAWFLMSISVAAWSAGFGVMVGGIFDKNTTLLLERLSHLGATFIAPFYLYFMLALIDKIAKYKKILILSYISAFIISCFVFTNIFIVDVVAKQSFKYYPEPGLMYDLFTMHFFLFVTMAEIIGFINFKFLSSSFARNQLRYVLFASIIGFLGGGTTFPLVYNIKFPPLGGPLVFLYAVVISYAIIRYRLMDIKLAITRFGIFAFLYTLVLGIPFGVGWAGKAYLEKLGYNWWLIPTGLCALFATIAPFVFIRLEKRTKELIYKNEFKRYEVLRQLSKTLLLIKDLDKLVELIVYRLVKTLRVGYAAIYLYDKEGNSYVLKGYRPKHFHSTGSIEAIPKDDPLIKLLFAWKKEVVREELGNLPLSTSIKELINLEKVQSRMHKILGTLIIPHFLDNELLGFLVLGDKEKSAVYTEEDISILSALSNSAALAIENALFLIDLKITQAELFNAKRIAELGYMASAMGHEINNRLQAIYSAAFDISDNPAITASIEGNPQIKEIFERDIKHINENIDDATAIINELKIYAKPQDNKAQHFEDLDIRGVIDKALNIVRLQSVQTFSSFDLDIRVPETLPKIQGNFIQLQQVFVNLLNNAHDAILERKQLMSQDTGLGPINEYKGNIQILALQVKNTIDIHIIDNGIGMTGETKKRLFIPLYTSKGSADRKTQRGIMGGTGIGLYTIQTIIHGHDGAISVYDTERFKGTDFLITLPMAGERTREKEKELRRKGII